MNIKPYLITTASAIAFSSCQTMYVPQAREVRKKPR